MAACSMYTIRPGIRVQGAGGSDGTLALLLKRSDDQGARYVLSAAHVLSFMQIDSGTCSKTPSEVNLPVRVFPMPPDWELLGQVVQQSCLKTGGNSNDMSVGGIETPSEWQVLSSPTSLEDVDYAIAHDEISMDRVIASGNFTVYRFGAVSSTSAPARCSSFTHVPDDVPVRISTTTLTYSSLVSYRSSPAGEPGDSGALIAVKLPPHPGQAAGDGPVEIAPLAIHIGADENDGTLCYCYPLSLIIHNGWEVAYDAPTIGA
jgi:hypothetical protein